MFSRFLSCLPKAGITTLLAVLLAASTAFAASTSATETFDRSTIVNALGQSGGEAPDGLSSCFDHYQFGSTPVILQSELTQTAAGSTFTFSGNVENHNAYNIPNATVWVKIVRVRDVHDGNGPDVVDFYPIAENLNIPAKGTLPVSGTWKVPTDAVNGSYQVLTFVTESDRFNLSGLTFSDDVVGNSLSFDVVAGIDGGVMFAKNGATIDDAPYAFALPAHSIGSSGKPSVVGTVTNTTNTGFKGTVEWKLYYWDAVGDNHLLDTKKVDVKVQPHATTTVAYQVSDATHTVDYVVGTLTTAAGSKSIIGVRFPRNGVTAPRLNFVGFDPSASAPVAFACVHSTTNALVKDATLKVAVYRSGVIGNLLNLLGPVAKAEYSGSVPSDIYALTVPVSSAGPLTVSAELSQGGKVIDRISEPYCAGEKCPGNSLGEWIGMTIAGLVILVILVVLLIRVRNRKNVPPAPPAIPVTPPPHV